MLLECATILLEVIFVYVALDSFPVLMTLTYVKVISNGMLVGSYLSHCTPCLQISMNVSVIPRCARMESVSTLRDVSTANVTLATSPAKTKGHV